MAGPWGTVWLISILGAEGTGCSHEFHCPSAAGRRIIHLKFAWKKSPAAESPWGSGNASVGKGLMKVFHSLSCFSEVAATHSHEVLQMGSEAQGEEGPRDTARSMCGDCLLLDVSLPPFFPTPLFCFLPHNYC